MESWVNALGLEKSISQTRLALAPRYTLTFALGTNKPYFGRELAAFQSPPIRYALMAAIARHMFQESTADAALLEIGSWAGASTITFGTAIRSLGLSDCHIVCIDPWQPYFDEVADTSIHYRVMNMAAASGRIERLFWHNVRACGLEENVRVMKTHSKAALPGLIDKSFDLVYVDGSHCLEDVLFDLSEAKRLVKHGGLICGDDLELLKSQVAPETHELALSEGTDFTIDPRTNVAYHPGVTEAISRAFDAVWQDSGLWCIQNVNGEWKPPEWAFSDVDIPSHLQHAVEVPFGDFRGYQIFQLGDTFVAYPAHVTGWFQNRILAESIDELILLLDSIDSLEETRFSHPQIIKTHCGYNIVAYRRKLWALDTTVGKVDFRDGERLKELLRLGRLFETDSVEAACIAAEEASCLSPMTNAEPPGLLPDSEGGRSVLPNLERLTREVSDLEMRLGVVESAQLRLEEHLTEYINAVRVMEKTLERLRQQIESLQSRIPPPASAPSVE